MIDCEGDSSGLLTLHYGKHNTSLVQEIKQWYLSARFADMTIICEDGQSVNVHRLVLASASPLVKRLLEDYNTTTHVTSNVVFLLPDTKFSHLKALLSYAYTGMVEVEVSPKRKVRLPLECWICVRLFDHGGFDSGMAETGVTVT